MPIPTDQTLYEEAKDFIYSKYKKNSAFRSGAVVKEYKQQFEEKYGKETQPYRDDNQPKRLKKWFEEKWVNINPLLGFKHADAYPLFRPTNYVNKDTPTLYQDIPKTRLKELYKEKQKIKGERNLPTFLPENLYPKVGGMIVKSYDY